MPIHPHFCMECKHEFDVITLSFKAEIDPTCPTCGAQAERRYGLPLAKTDQNLLRGAKFSGAQFDGDAQAASVYMAEAKRAGINPAGKIYQHGLARFPGDPEAWVSDIGEAKKKLRQKGWGSEQLGIKGREVERPEQVAVGEDILNRAVRQQIREGKIEAKDAEKERGAIADAICPIGMRGKYRRPTKAKRASK